jgi:hypothetical protein
MNSPCLEDSMCGAAGAIPVALVPMQGWVQMWGGGPQQAWQHNCWPLT